VKDLNNQAVECIDTEIHINSHHTSFLLFPESSMKLIANINKYLPIK